MAEQTHAQSFNLFTKLPIELQRAIWEACLPSRVIELDALDAELLGISCDPWRTSILNTRAPLITRVCHESRALALLHGGQLYDDYDATDNNNDRPQWWSSHDLSFTYPWHGSARNDVLHLNWVPAYNAILMSISGNPLPFFLWMARHKHMRMSITAPLILDFDLDGPAIYNLGGGDNLNLLGDSGPYLVTLYTVSLHVGLDLALQTCLFGSLGEERVQLINAGNKVALQAYHDLWTAGPVKDQEPAAFFDLAVQRHESDWLPQVAEWQRRLEIEWVCNRLGPRSSEDIWLSLSDDEVGKLPTYGADQLPPGSRAENILRRVPNKEHPQVMEVMQRMPRFEPMVMFRLCGERCFEPKPQ